MVNILDKTDMKEMLSRKEKKNAEFLIGSEEGTM